MGKLSSAIIRNLSKAQEIRERGPNRKKFRFDHGQTDRAQVQVLSCAFAAKNSVDEGPNAVVQCSHVEKDIVELNSPTIFLSQSIRKTKTMYWRLDLIARGLVIFLLFTFIIYQIPSDPPSSTANYYPSDPELLHLQLKCSSHSRSERCVGPSEEFSRLCGADKKVATRKSFCGS